MRDYALFACGIIRRVSARAGRPCHIWSQIVFIEFRMCRWRMLQRFHVMIPLWRLTRWRAAKVPVEQRQPAGVLVVGGLE